MKMTRSELQSEIERLLASAFDESDSFRLASAIHDLCRATAAELCGALRDDLRPSNEAANGGSEPADEDEFAARKFWDEWAHRGEEGPRERAENWPEEVAFFRRVIQHGRDAGRASLAKRIEAYERLVVNEYEKTMRETFERSPAEAYKLAESFRMRIGFRAKRELSAVGTK